MMCVSDDFSVIEEIAALWSLKGRTTGEDIPQSSGNGQFFRTEMEIISTDGANLELWLVFAMK